MPAENKITNKSVFAVINRRNLKMNKTKLVYESAKLVFYFESCVVMERRSIKYLSHMKFSLDFETQISALLREITISSKTQLPKFIQMNLN